MRIGGPNRISQSDQGEAPPTLGPARRRVPTNRLAQDSSKTKEGVTYNRTIQDPSKTARGADVQQDISTTKEGVKDTRTHPRLGEP